MKNDTYRDILIKAAEDVQQGLWCTGHWFYDDKNHVGYLADHIFAKGTGLTLEDAALMRKCAEGSVAYATVQAGGGVQDYQKVIKLVNANVPDCDDCYDAFDARFNPKTLNHYNDVHLDSMDQFGSGQKLAELFRKTADSL